MFTFHCLFYVSASPFKERKTLFSSITCSFLRAVWFWTLVAVTLGAWLMLHCLNIPNKTVKCIQHWPDIWYWVCFCSAVIRSWLHPINGGWMNHTYMMNDKTFIERMNIYKAILVSFVHLMQRRVTTRLTSSSHVSTWGVKQIWVWWYVLLQERLCEYVF